MYLFGKYYTQFKVIRQDSKSQHLPWSSIDLSIQTRISAAEQAPKSHASVSLAAAVLLTSPASSMQRTGKLAK
jgi:hypothetical protein